MAREVRPKIKKVKVARTSNNIVIIGGGFGGVRAAIDLSLKCQDSEIILIDKNSFHSYTSDYYELATALFKHDLNLTRERLLTLKSTLAIPFALIFKNSPNVKFIQASVSWVDFDKREVRTEQGVLSYSYLVIALGSETNFYDIPHLSEKAFELKCLDDALNIRAELDELFQSRAKHEVISIVVGGGGFTGCELAGELAFSLEKISEFYHHPPKNVSITIVEATDKLLGSSGEWFSKKALARFKKLGVRVSLNSFIEDVRDGKVFLRQKSPIPYDLLVWTAGVKACGLVEKFPAIEFSKHKCVVVGKKLETSHENVFAIGDIAYVIDPNSQKPLAMTAQGAIAEGRYIVSYISAKMRGEDHPNFAPKLTRFVIPIGGKYALADLGFMKISGLTAWSLKRIVALKYLLSILPPGEAFRIWWRGLDIFTNND